MNIAINTRRDRRRNLAFGALVAVLTVYFVYHAISGERGFLALVRLAEEVQKSHEELETVRAERITLEHRVKLLRPDSLDLDLVEEQARALLGYARPGDTVLIAPERGGGME